MIKQDITRGVSFDWIGGDGLYGHNTKLCDGLDELGLFFVIKAYSHSEYAYFVSQRYWVERSFDNAKNELGMSDYQIRKWQSWHTHHAIMMLTSLLITTKLIESKEEIPLLSFKDARILIVTQICKNKIEMEQNIIQMYRRHVKRKADIDWNCNKQKLG